MDADIGDEAAMEEPVTSSEELTRRINHNGHFVFTAIQLAELSTHDWRQEMTAAVKVPQPRFEDRSSISTVLHNSHSLVARQRSGAPC